MMTIVANRRHRKPLWCSVVAEDGSFRLTLEISRHICNTLQKPSSWLVVVQPGGSFICRTHLEHTRAIRAMGKIGIDPPASVLAFCQPSSTFAAQSHWSGGQLSIYMWCSTRNSPPSLYNGKTVFYKNYFESETHLLNHQPFVQSIHHRRDDIFIGRRDDASSDIYCCQGRDVYAPYQRLHCWETYIVISFLLADNNGQTFSAGGRPDDKTRQEDLFASQKSLDVLLIQPGGMPSTTLRSGDADSSMFQWEKGDSFFYISHLLFRRLVKESKRASNNGVIGGNLQVSSN